MKWKGRISTFGGPGDMGMIHDTGLTLYEPAEADRAVPLFEDGPHSQPTWQRLRTSAFYIALPFSGKAEGALRRQLQAADFKITNPLNGESAIARLVDRGPAADTQRLVDMSQGLADHLGLATDDVAEVELLTPIEGFALTVPTSWQIA